MRRHWLRTNPTNESQREGGSVTVLTAGILAVVGSITFAVVKLGVAANDRARAQAVADLGSLAGASVDLTKAKQVVASNGGVVLQATASGESVDVAVSVGGAQAQARAERTYVSWNPIDTGPGVVDDLETTTVATLAVPTTSATITPTTIRALIFPTIPQIPPQIPPRTPTTRALVFPTIPPVTTKKPAATLPPKLAPAPGTSPRR
jgi:hypothetical protein